ncbi:MAG TPA: hypothetical protein VHY77_05050, partial [Acidimicrobiales bacterium]|nr:hypothetical protein [Acidimicrobiales bacterium]
PLLGRPTGVGVFCAGALGGLAQLDEVDVSAFAISWRRRQGIVELVPQGVSTHQRAMPARPLHASWRRWGVPPLEWFVGAHQVVHGTNFVVPPARRAARRAGGTTKLVPWMTWWVPTNHSIGGAPQRRHDSWRGRAGMAR